MTVVLAAFWVSSAAAQAPNAGSVSDMAALKEGVAFLKATDFDNAIAAFDRAIALNPNLAPAYHGRGLAWEQKGETAKAESDFREAIRLNPAKSSDAQGLARSAADLVLPDSDDIPISPSWRSNLAQSLANLNAAIKLAPNLTDAYILRAKYEYASGDYDAAVRSLDAAINVDSSLPGPFALRARAWCKKRDYEKAEADCTTAIKLDPQIAQPHFQRGICFQLQGKHEKAIEDFTNALTLDPRYAIALYHRGLSEVAMGRDARALKDFDEAVYVLAWPTYKSRGELYQRAKKLDQAIADYTKAIEQKLSAGAAAINYENRQYDEDRFYQVLTDLTKTPYTDAETAQLFFARGVCLQEKGDFSGAIASFTKGLMLCRDHATPLYLEGRKLRTATYMTAVAAFTTQGKFDQAIALCDELIVLDEKNADAYLARGNVRQGRKDYDKAIDDYATVLRLDPNRTDAFQAAGDVFLQKGDGAKAISCFSKLILKKPDDLAALLARGKAYFQTGDDAKAIADYTKIIALDPNVPESYEARGHAFKRAGKLKEAADDYYEALRLESETFACCASRGDARNQPDGLRDSAKKYDARIEQNDGDYDAYLNRGHIYFALDDYNRAIADLTKAHRLAPRNYEPMHCLGNAYLAVKDYDNAVRAYKEGAAASNGDDEIYRLGIADAYYQKAVAQFGAQSENNAPSKSNYFKMALGEYREIAREIPTSTAAAVALADIYLNCPDSALRNADEAMRLAEKWTANYHPAYDDDNPNLFALLAGAYASKGDFKSAIEWQCRAILSGEKAKAPALARRLADYLARCPELNVERPSLKPRHTGNTAPPAVEGATASKSNRGRYGTVNAGEEPSAEDAKTPGYGEIDLPYKRRRP